MKCSHCGHENPTEYGFCGMCGKTLRQPSPLRPAEMEEPAPVYLPDLRERGAPVARQVTESAPSATSISGPSFLGLGDQTSAPEFSYLLEDEPSRGPGRILLALVIILALAGLGWWQVQRHGGNAWLISVLRNPKQLMQKGNAEDGVPADRLNRSKAALEDSTTNPNATREAILQVEGDTLVPKQGESLDIKKSGAQTSADQSDGSSSADSQDGQPGKVNAEQAVRKQPPSEVEPSNSKSPKNTEAAVRKPAVGENASAKSKTPRSGAEQATSGESGDEEAASEPDTRPVEAKKLAAKTQQAARSPEDSNVLIAQKYLYGQGVRQDCNRALTLLRPAADSSSVKARTLLGAMYATGHCVPQNLPSSYHWFALALREDPNNIWVSRNLQSIWNQMSDSEKQTAMRMSK